MADTKEEVALRVSNDAGKVTLDGIENVKRVELEPEAAYSLAQHLVKHADLARGHKPTAVAILSVEDG